MDTSTLSSTSDQPLTPLTSTLVKQQAQPPAAEWFTRLISPLTGTRAALSGSSVSSASSQASSIPASLSSSTLSSSSSDSSSFSSEQEDPSTRRSRLRTIMQESRKKQVNMQPNDLLPPRRHSISDEVADSGLSTMLLVFIPIMVVILTVLLGMVCFLVAVLLMRRRRGIILTEDGGPLDLSKSDGVMGEGGVDGVETRWLETVEPDVREAYKRAKDWQDNYPPTSVPTDITLSQFLSIQEKGVSAWAFEPEYEDNLSLYVQSRTEITFLSDGPGMAPREGGGNSVMANLPLPKLNEVYYWEVKMYDKPANTEVAIGLATKPYPSFRLPGWNKYSVAYFASDGFKSHNYPFTASSYSAPLAEGDVLGVGYRPRTGTVFFTRNGRKLDDCYTGLQKWNLFPTIGANGPCTIHVNLGQAGFVFIEANVKKWGLAPMTGTLAPPPAYGSERGSILLDAGYGTPGASQSHSNMGALLEAARARSAGGHFGSSAGSTVYSGQPPHSSMPSPGRSSNSSRRHRRAGRAANLAGTTPVVPSPLRVSDGGPGPATAGSRRRALGRAGEGNDRSYISPTDTPVIMPRVPSPDALEYIMSESDGDGDADGDSMYDSTSSHDESSPLIDNPPTPNLLDISLHSLRNSQMYYVGRSRSEDGRDSADSDETARPPRPIFVSAHQGQGNSPPPPGYAPLDPHMYATGLPTDLPEELVTQAIAAMSADAGNAPPEPQRSPPSPSPWNSGALAWLGLSRRSEPSSG